MQADSETPVLQSLPVWSAARPTTSLQDLTTLTSLAGYHASSRNSSLVAFAHVSFADKRAGIARGLQATIR
jgi:hypothetical protein